MAGLTVAGLLALSTLNQGGGAAQTERTGTSLHNEATSPPGEFNDVWIFTLNSDSKNSSFQNVSGYEDVAEGSHSTHTHVRSPLTHPTRARLPDLRDDTRHLTTGAEPGLEDRTSSAATSGRPLHSVGLEDQPETAGRQASLTPRGTPAVGDQCAARLVPGFSGSVWTDDETYGQNVLTYTVTAVNSSAPASFFICSRFAASTTTVLQVTTTKQVCPYKLQSLLRAFLMNVLFGQCTNFQHTSVFEHSDTGVRFDIEIPGPYDPTLPDWLQPEVDTQPVFVSAVPRSSVSPFRSRRATANQGTQ